LRETGFGQQRGCVSVVVAGVKDGKRREYRLHMASTSRALGEGTGIPAAMGVMLMAEGKIARTGVLPPEAAVEPMDFVALWRALEGQAEHAERDGAPTMLIERVDEHGTVETINL
jgi:saccharopine dehydrogenase (NAD+, L-lysine-forming)